MGLPENADGAIQVLPLTPLKMLGADSESSSNSSSPVNLIGPLTLPTVLQQGDKAEQKTGQQSNKEAQEALEMARSVGLLDLYTRPKLFLPILPKPFFGLSGLKWLSENPLRQRGLRFRPEEDPKAFVICQLCGNSILGNREINLQNHARRHSSLKQFQCCYCHYVHSEITKVRLHMAHNHNDNYSRPVNNVSPEMRDSWRALMNDCFPGHPFVSDQMQRRYSQYAAAAAMQFQRMGDPSAIDYSKIRYRPY